MDSGKWLERFSLDCDMKYTNSAQTRNNYKSCISVFLNRFKGYEQPKAIPTEVIERYLLEYRTINTRKANLCAVKAFYRLTIRMSNKIDRIPFPQNGFLLNVIIKLI